MKQYFWVFNLFVIFIAATFVADATGNLVVAHLKEPQAADQTGGWSHFPHTNEFIAGENQDHVNEIPDGTELMKRNVFDSKTGSVLPVDEDDEVDGGVDDAGQGEEELAYFVPCEDPDIDVLATVVSSEPEWSFVSIDHEGESRLYRKGMEVDDWEIFLITRKYVFFDDDDDSEGCYLDLWKEKKKKRRRRKHRKSRRSKRSSKHKGVRKLSRTRREIDRSLIRDAVRHPEKITRGVRIRPYRKNGRTKGYKFYGVRSSSLLGKLGLRNGDIVHSINDREIRSPQQAMSAYDQLRDADELEIEITRRRKPVTLEIEID